MLLLTESDVASLLSMRDAVALMEDAFRAQAEHRVQLPVRTMAPTPRGVLGAMPVAIAAPATGGQAALGAKLVTAFAGNAQLGKPSHQALVLLFDADDGTPLAIMDGRYITEVRTAATSALATKYLARRGASVVAIIGTGVQARAHVDALRVVMDIDAVRIWGRTPAHAERLAGYVGSLGLKASVTSSAAEAARGAHVICTTTNSYEPLLDLHEIEAGTHINAVGFAWPDGRELGAKLMAAARIIVDSAPSALSESGDIKRAIANGALPIRPELVALGDVVVGGQQGRRSDEEITIFESVGLAVEDIACARHVYERAQAAHTGSVMAL